MMKNQFCVTSHKFLDDVEDFEKCKTRSSSKIESHHL